MENSQPDPADANADTPVDAADVQHDPRLFDLLDSYVAALHQADPASRSVLLERHPELQKLLGCLETLDVLAPPREMESASSPPADRFDVDVPTQIGTGQPPQETSAAEKSDEERSPGENEGAENDFGKYQLQREIGRGGMGVVYLARQTNLDRTVALKMILSSRLASPEDVRRFASEAKAAASLHHPNIVAIHEAGQIHGQHYFAMDYVEGLSLAELLQKGPLEADHAAECLAAIAGAVHYLHEHSIVHRDLKPANILLDADGRPFVTDFGLVKVFGTDSEQTRSGMIIGTPSYMAPEQAAGKTADISPRSDIYSLGAVFYAMLIGRPPFQHENPLETLVDVLEGEPTLPSKLNASVPRELELVCLKCLEKDPARRYATAAELAADLTRYLKGEPVSARPNGLLQRIRRWTRREPALVSRLGGLTIAAAIIQARFFYNRFFALPEHDVPYHLRIISILACWAAVSCVFQKLMHRQKWAHFARFSWALADAVLLTTALSLAEPPLGPLLIGYPLLIAAAGLFFRVRLVVFMTTVCVLAYLALQVIRSTESMPFHYSAIFAAVLIVIGFMVGHQVQRVRALSRYYDRRQLP
ncbi:MAG: serine/threonine protein kinase [Planctomycetes bacterium]|nr:serine/threonine protein kinase [Planctomycetota bacterium]